MARAEDSHILLRGHVCCTEASVIPHPRSHFSDLLKQKPKNCLSLFPKNKKSGHYDRFFTYAFTRNHPSFPRMSSAVY